MKPPYFICSHLGLTSPQCQFRAPYKLSVYSHIDCLLKVHARAVNRYHCDAMAPARQS